MKSSSFKLSVGLAGFLRHETPPGCEPTRALAGFSENPPKPGHKPDHKPAARHTGRARWPRDTIPDSRHPLVPPEVRAKIEAVEADARAKGWPAELLWNAGFWDCPRGLAAVLEAEDEITAVNSDYIEILKTRRDLLRFRRMAA